MPHHSSVPILTVNQRKWLLFMCIKLNQFETKYLTFNVLRFTRCIAFRHIKFQIGFIYVVCMKIPVNEWHPEVPHNCTLYIQCSSNTHHLTIMTMAIGSWNILTFSDSVQFLYVLALNIYLLFELCECDATYIYERMIMEFKINENRQKKQMNNKNKKIECKTQKE